LLTASQLLLGYPQYVWFSLLAEIAFVAWRAASGKARVSRLATLALAVTLGVAAGAVQWMPTLHLLGESTRPTADAAFRNTGSLAPLNLVQWLAPYLFQTRVVGQNTHELGLYIGAVPTVLCIWLLAHRREWGRFRPLVGALLVFGAVALLLAAGEFGPLYAWQSWVPLANRFRFPCRAIVLVQLCMAGGAAVAAAILFARNARSDRKPVSRVLWLPFLASVVLAIAGPLAWPDFVSRGLLVWTGPLLVGIAALLIALVERGVRKAAIALVLFTALDLSCYGLSYSVVGRTADLGRFVAAIKLPPDAAKGGQANRRVAAPDRSLGPRVGDRMLLAPLVRVDGYAGLEPAKRLDYRRKRAWQLAGAGWVWQADEPGETNRAWVRLSPTAPRARLVSQSQKSSVLFSPALVEPAVELTASEPGSARVVDDRPGNITIDTDCPGRQLLVTTESFDSGWQVLVDGQPVGIVRVDGDFLGCGVKAGKHRVQFGFRPRCRQLGVLASISGLGLMVLASCMGVFFRRPRRGEEGVTCCEKL
jgi:Bacterial membrane protein YfhO